RSRKQPLHPSRDSRRPCASRSAPPAAGPRPPLPQRPCPALSPPPAAAVPAPYSRPAPEPGKRRVHPSLPRRQRPAAQARCRLLPPWLWRGGRGGSARLRSEPSERGSGRRREEGARQRGGGDRAREPRRTPGPSVTGAAGEEEEVAEEEAAAAARDSPTPTHRAENKIILDPMTFSEARFRPSLEERLESIISGAALMADSSCTRDDRRERIVAECNAVRQALQDLLSEYMNNVSDKGHLSPPEAAAALMHLRCFS
uniref:Catenin alpha 2 n=1 Tax=Junco hyemalis TaxID=40217 RepID=A0A8C5IMA9_JUNHY